MKKLFLLCLSVILFALNTDSEIKLNVLENKIKRLETEIKNNKKEIEQLKKLLNIQNKKIEKSKENVKKEIVKDIRIRSCDGIKVLSLTYTYENDFVDSYYQLKFKLQNTYPKKIVFLEGDLYAEDKDGVKILQDFIKRDISLEPGQTVTIIKKHIINNELEQYLKDENPKNLKIYFKVIKAKFADGSETECGIF